MPNQNASNSLATYRITVSFISKFFENLKNVLLFTSKYFFMDRVSKFKFLSTEFIKIKHKFEFDLKEFQSFLETLK